MGGAAGGTVLVVDDAESIRTVVRWQLESEGFAVVEAVDGPSALQQIRSTVPDLVVLDLSLPGVGGLDVLRSVREGRVGDPAQPVIVLSGRSGEADRIVGLDLGADNYLVKPFSPGELVARVRSVLRRSVGPAPERVVPIEIGGLTVDPGGRRLLGPDGTEVELTAREFDLLHFLAAHPEQVFSREQLLTRVWESSPEWLGAATVTEHVHRLRHKLEPHGAGGLIRTVRGAGYRVEGGP